MSKRAVIAGWSHIPFGKLDDPDTESLMAGVRRGWTMPASPPRKSTASTSAS